MADLVDVSVDRYASLIAPVIERLTFAIVRVAAERGVAFVTQHQITPGALRRFGQLRTVLQTRTVTAEGFAAVYRYDQPDELRRDVDAIGAAGLIVLDERGTAQATETGRRVLAEMYAIDAEIAATLWRGQMSLLPGLNDAAGRLVTAALATGGPAYLTMAPPHEPADAPAGLLLHHRLSVLRYHRADAHAAAWQGAGLTSQEIQQLSIGPIRDAVEARTNTLAGTPYDTLAPDERLKFLAGLAALPG